MGTARRGCLATVSKASELCVSWGDAKAILITLF